MTRLEVATQILNGMLASTPLCDRTAIDKKRWCKVAVEWADLLIKTAKTTPRKGPR